MKQGVCLWVLILLLPCQVSCVYGQEQYALPENRVWCFGENAGLDFNGGSPVPITTNMRAPENASAVCDRQGQLLFYTFGKQVWDRMGNVMPNTNSGMPYWAHDAIQGSVIVPVPDSMGKYYLFSLESAVGTVVNGDTIKGNGRFSYSVVNMALNNGMGDVEPERKAIPLDSNLSECMVAVPGDRCNVWVIVHSSVRGLFQAYEITRNGLNAVPVTSPSGISSASVTIYTSDMRISPDRTRLVISAGNFQAYSSGTKLFDFDPASGILSNEMIIDEARYAGACFSPGSSKLYVKDNDRDIYQYDLTSAIPSVIYSTKTLIARGRSTSPPGLYDLKIGPDGKIYTAADRGRFLSAINAPDLAGVACQYTPNVVQLSANTSLSSRLNSEVAVFIRDPVPGRQVIPVCFRNSVLLQADRSGRQHIWDDSSVLTDRTVYESGAYVVQYITDCRHHTDTFFVHFFTVPSTGFTQGCRNVNNNAAWVQPGPGDTSVYVYSWTDSAGQVLRVQHSAAGDTLPGLAPGLYRVSLRGSNGCDTSLFVRIPPPGYRASFRVDTGACDMQFLNTSTGDFTAWAWDFGDGSTSTQHSPSHRYTHPGAYTVRLIAQTQYPCYDTAYATVMIDSVPYVYFTTDNDSICAGEAVTFTPAYLSGISGLKWQFGAGTDTIRSGGERQVRSFEDAGGHIVTITASWAGCPDTSFSDTVRVFPYPLVDIGSDTSICPGGASVVVSDRVARPPDHRRRWNTGDTTAAIHAAQPGIFFLEVTSGHNCVAADSVTVFKSCYISIPNVFTPDGDGYNDYFFPRQLLSAALTRFRMQLYNRWGQLIFESTQLDGRGWDGKLNGDDQPAGVYIYVIEAAFANGDIERHQGNVTLLR